MKNKFNVKGLTVTVQEKPTELAVSFQGTIDGIALAGTGSYGEGDSADLAVDVVSAFEGGTAITDLYELSDLNDSVWTLIQSSADFQAWTK